MVADGEPVAENLVSYLFMSTLKNNTRKPDKSG